ncbi:MAG: hypothetical protein DMD64_13020 [Gemmatimonadetes bacterium]|nr:MAG: hypothetical protein DMD64_13020 [Gemmatimonadota bacterium]
MYCSSCQARPRTGAAQGRIWGLDRISGLRCSRCGALLGADDIAHLLLAKQSQLEQFGLLRPPTHADPTTPQPAARALRVVRTEKH